LLAIFFDSFKCIIKEDFTIISNLKEEENNIESEIINQASDKIKNLFKSLYVQDDLFNCLSFINSPILQVDEQSIFYFSQQNSFSTLKRKLSEQCFNSFILFDFGKIEHPVNEFYESEEFMEEVSYEIKFKVSFVSNEFLNDICCLNKSIMRENFSDDLKREKYSFKILHERIHFILFGNKLKLKNTSIKSPLVKVLLKDQQKLAADSGDMIEYMMSVI